MFVDLESMIYAFVRSSLLQEQMLVICSLNMMSLSENADIEIKLLLIASKIDKIIYTIWCM